MLGVYLSRTRFLSITILSVKIILSFFPALIGTTGELRCYWERFTCHYDVAAIYLGENVGSCLDRRPRLTCSGRPMTAKSAFVSSYNPTAARTRAITLSATRFASSAPRARTVSI